jgi:hypothetical protein
MSLLDQSRKLLLALACATVALVALAGCGSGDTTAAQQEETIPVAQYIKRADAICTKTDKKQKTLATQVGVEGADLSSKKGVEVLVRKAAVPPLEQESRELSELPPPAKQGSAVTKYLAAIDKGIKSTKDDPLALPEGNPGPFAEAEEIAQTVGFKVCSGA